MQNILILGSGGREHALAWKIKESIHCGELFIAPGNAGTQQCGTNLNIAVLDFNGIEKAIEKYKIDLVIVGPEAPLVEGIYDHFKSHPVNVLGPSKASSQLEGSKAFANEFMKEFNVPTAGYLTVGPNNIQEGLDYIDKQPSKIVLKADGLAAGKGVLILDSKEEAKEELKLMLSGKFGDASARVVIEEFLDGLEFSVFVLTNGDQYQILPIAKDYKRIGEGDTGLNTGGMGAISPVPFVDDVMKNKVISRIVKPTIEGLKIRNYDYHGFIFIGLIKVNDEPYVIEYNCRLGDPETEVILPRLKTDLLSLINGVFDKTLSDIEIEIDNRSAATVMLVSGGYPEAYEKGKSINIKGENNNSLVFHAGTKIENSQLITNGGRVIAVTSFGDNHKEAVNTSIETIKNISFDKMNYRKDIGFDL
jgi:phosphoribosylamine--glycine ligase